MQPYQPNSIEQQKQQVRKDARNTLIAVGVAVGSFVVAGWFLEVAIIITVAAGIYAIYSANKVRKAISGKPKQGELY